MTDLNRAMLKLAADPRTIFVGQSVRYTGTSMYADLEGVSYSQRVEFPVAEELQLGYCTGLALQGFRPVCIFPRIDFLMRAMDQLVNHLDKMTEMSCGQFRPGVILRTRVGARSPLDAGPQHTQDHSLAVSRMMTSIIVLKTDQSDAERAYAIAAQRAGDGLSTLVVEVF